MHNLASVTGCHCHLQASTEVSLVGLQYMDAPIPPKWYWLPSKTCLTC